jgi:hypothetical protein
MRVGPGGDDDGGSVKPGQLSQNWSAARLVVTDSLASAAGQHAHLLVAKPGGPGHVGQSMAVRLVLTGRGV